MWEKWKARTAYNFPRRFLQRTLLPHFGIDPYSSGSRKNTANDLGRSIQRRTVCPTYSVDVCL
ncbi:hypothetical protein EMIT0232MI5_20323 [Pseudomonas sp. IT-232MI5]